MRVSIITTCYNGEKTVGRALDSVLAQKTNFDFHIIVVDDHSIDKSLDVIRQRYNNSDKIGVIESQENYGTMASYRVAFGRCLGEYIAVCEGDDYWIDRLKIQKPVEPATIQCPKTISAGFYS